MPGTLEQPDVFWETTDMKDKNASMNKTKKKTIYQLDQLGADL